VDEHDSKHASLETKASTSSDTVTKLEQEVGHLKQVVIVPLSPQNLLQAEIDAM